MHIDVRVHVNRLQHLKPGMNKLHIMQCIISLDKYCEPPTPVTSFHSSHDCVFNSVPSSNPVCIAERVANLTYDGCAFPASDVTVYLLSMHVIQYSRHVQQSML